MTCMFIILHQTLIVSLFFVAQLVWHSCYPCYIFSHTQSLLNQNVQWMDEVEQGHQESFNSFNFQGVFPSLYNVQMFIYRITHCSHHWHPSYNTSLALEAVTLDPNLLRMDTKVLQIQMDANLLKEKKSICVVSGLTIWGSLGGINTEPWYSRTGMGFWRK